MPKHFDEIEGELEKHESKDQDGGSHGMGGPGLPVEENRLLGGDPRPGQGGGNSTAQAAGYPAFENPERARRAHQGGRVLPLDLREQRARVTRGLACEGGGQVGFSAVRYLPERRERITADIVWTGWGSAFQGWTATLSNPSTEDLGSMLGGDGSTTLDLDMNWRDAFSLSMAWEKDLTLLHTFRTGVGWSQNPVGGSPLPGLVPFDRLHFGLGFSRRGKTDGGDWHCSFVAALPETWTTGSNAVLSDFSGDRYTQADYALVVGWSRTW